MRKHKLKALRIGISRNGLTLLGTGGWLRRHTEVLCDYAMDTGCSTAFAEVATRLEKAIGDAKCARLPLTVVVADDLARFFMVTPPHNTNRLQDCRAAAELRFHTLYGESPEGWQLAADWAFGAPFLACALPRPLLQSVQSAADAHRLTLVEIVPQFVAAWNTWASALKENAWFGVVHGNILTLAAMKGEQLISVRTTSISEEASHDKHWLIQHVTREALRLNTEVPTHMQLHGEVPEQWISQSGAGLGCERLDGQRNATPQARATGVVLAATGVRL